MATELPQSWLKLVAQAAERLLAAEDPARMVDELFELIESELRLDVFFNYRLDDDRLVLEAYGGLTDEQAAAGAELQLGQAVCGCAARDRQRFHMINVQASDDPLVAFVKGIGLDAYACTPLMHGNKLIGTLGFGRKWVDRFSSEELHFLHTLCHYVELAKFRLSVEQELREGVRHRERLLDELNHRVRNALQLAVSLVRLEATAGQQEASPGPLARVADRIELMASVHRPMYDSDDLRTIGLADLLNDVASGFDAYPVGIVELPEMRLSIEKGVGLALLVDTVLHNALGSIGQPTFELAAEADDRQITIILGGLTVAKSALEERMTRAFLKQLEAQFTVEAQSVTLRIPIE